MKINKCDRGYIEAKKKRSIIYTLITALIGITVFIVGLFLNKMSNRNIFTVIAVLFALPAAKFLVGFIVVFPYHSVSRERYEKVKEHIVEGMELYTDLVITSAEKVMNLDFAAVGNKQVICLVGKKGQDIVYIRKYLSDGVNNWGSGYKVKVVDSEKIFINELDGVKTIEKDEKEQEEEENVKSFLKSLIV